MGVRKSRDYIEYQLMMSGYHPETSFLQHILSSLPDLGYSETLTPGGASRRSRSIFTTKHLHDEAGSGKSGFLPESGGAGASFPSAR